jgi:hypothetical protein
MTGWTRKPETRTSTIGSHAGDLHLRASRVEAHLLVRLAQGSRLDRLVVLVDCSAGEAYLTGVPVLAR